jgi:hypothetical protein
MIPASRCVPVFRVPVKNRAQRYVYRLPYYNLELDGGVATEARLTDVPVARLFDRLQ